MRRVVVLVLMLLGVSARAGPLAVTLEPERSDPRQNRFEATLRNTGTVDVVVVKPLDGSLWSWVLPFYRFTVTGADGKELAMVRRNIVWGLWSETRWPDDYLVTLKPGETFTTVLALRFEIPRDGEYTVVLDYVMDPAQDPNKGQVLDYPASVWTGSVSSVTGRYRLKAP